MVGTVGKVVVSKLQKRRGNSSEQPEMAWKDKDKWIPVNTSMLLPPPKKNKDTNHITMMVQNMYFFRNMDILDIYLEFQRGYIWNYRDWWNVFVRLKLVKWECLKFIKNFIWFFICLNRVPSPWFRLKAQETHSICLSFLISSLLMGRLSGKRAGSFSWKSHTMRHQRCQVYTLMLQMSS